MATKFDALMARRGAPAAAAGGPGSGESRDGKDSNDTKTAAPARG